MVARAGGCTVDRGPAPKLSPNKAACWPILGNILFQIEELPSYISLEGVYLRGMFESKKMTIHYCIKVLIQPPLSQLEILPPATQKWYLLRSRRSIWVEFRCCLPAVIHSLVGEEAIIPSQMEVAPLQMQDNTDAPTQAFYKCH